MVNILSKSLVQKTLDEVDKTVDQVHKYEGLLDEEGLSEEKESLLRNELSQLRNQLRMERDQLRMELDQRMETVCTSLVSLFIAIFSFLKGIWTNVDSSDVQCYAKPYDMKVCTISVQIGDALLMLDEDRLSDDVLQSEVHTLTTTRSCPLRVYTSDTTLLYVEYISSGKKGSPNSKL